MQKKYFGMHNICIFSFYDGQYCWFTHAQKNQKVSARTILDFYIKFLEEFSLPQSLYGGHLSLQRNE